MRMEPEHPVDYSFICISISGFKQNVCCTQPILSWVSLHGCSNSNIDIQQINVLVCRVIYANLWECVFRCDDCIGFGNYSNVF